MTQLDLFTTTEPAPIDPLSHVPANLREYARTIRSLVRDEDVTAIEIRALWSCWGAPGDAIETLVRLGVIKGVDGKGKLFGAG